MAHTLSTDLIQPETFTDYVDSEVVTFPSLINSALVSRDAKFNDFVSNVGGTDIVMPFWKQLAGKSRPMTEGETIPVQSVKAGKEIATKIIRETAWGSSDLSGALAGDSPRGMIARQVAEWQVEEVQETLMSLLDGAFSSAGTEPLIYGDGTEAMSSSFLVDAQFTNDGMLADRVDFLVCHPKVFAKLYKDKLINAATEANGHVAYYGLEGFRVLTNPYLKPTDGIYKSYLARAGVIAYGTGTPTDVIGAEVVRQGLENQTALVYRPSYLLHAHGFKWKGQGSIAKTTPDNAELATGTNWELVYDIKQMGIMQLLHKV